SYAGMSGSGSAVFGLFGGRRAADRACRLLSRRGKRVLVTRTLGRAQIKARARPFKVAETGREGRRTRGIPVAFLGGDGLPRHLTIGYTYRSRCVVFGHS